MMLPLNTLDMVKYMHDEIEEKRAASQQRELVALYGEYRPGWLTRFLFRRNRIACSSIVSIADAEFCPREAQHAQ